MNESKPFQILDYLTEEGVVPFRRWLNSLKDVRARAAIRARIARLEAGNMGDCKLLGQGVYELRIHLSPGYRVYFGIEKQNIVILLLGGDKKRQESDIKIAQRYWVDYRRIGS